MIDTHSNQARSCEKADLRREKSANYYIVKSQRFFVKVSSNRGIKQGNSVLVNSNPGMLLSPFGDLSYTSILYYWLWIMHYVFIYGCGAICALSYPCKIVSLYILFILRRSTKFHILQYFL